MFLVAYYLWNQIIILGDVGVGKTSVLNQHVRLFALPSSTMLSKGILI